MAYKEYTASEGKVLLNLDDFHYSTITACKLDAYPNLIEVSREDAVYYNQKYQEELMNKEYEEHFGVQEEAPIEEDKPLLRGTKSAPKDSLTLARESYIEELTAKGYDVNKFVEPVIHK